MPRRDCPWTVSSIVCVERRSPLRLPRTAAVPGKRRSPADEAADRGVGGINIASVGTGDPARNGTRLGSVRVAGLRGERETPEDDVPALRPGPRRRSGTPRGRAPAREAVQPFGRDIRPRSATSASRGRRRESSRRRPPRLLLRCIGCFRRSFPADRPGAFAFPPRKESSRLEKKEGVARWSLLSGVRLRFTGTSRSPERPLDVAAMPCRHHRGYDRSPAAAARRFTGARLAREPPRRDGRNANRVRPAPDRAAMPLALPTALAYLPPKERGNDQR